jgi:hypothetical protein
MRPAFLIRAQILYTRIDSCLLLFAIHPLYQKYHFVETFAGDAVVSKIWKTAGYHIAALDKEYDKTSLRSAMDLLTPSGFGSAS